jgi:hypothetical protein
MLAVVWFLPHYAVPVASALPLLSLLWLLRDQEVKFLVIQFVFCFVWLCAVVAFLEHYAAPLTATFFVLLVQALRYLRRWEHGGRVVGIGLSRVVVLFAIGMVPVQIAGGDMDSFLCRCGTGVEPGASAHRCSAGSHAGRTPCDRALFAGSRVRPGIRL